MASCMPRASPRRCARWPWWAPRPAATSCDAPRTTRKAFDTIRPLYFFDERLAVESVAARAETRYRLAVRRFIIEHEYARYDCRAELVRIACPTLVAVGRHDWICPVDQAEEIRRLVPHSTLAVFEASGHSPHVEERDAFVRALGATFRSSAPP